MHYLIDEKNKIAFGHSAKSGSSHIRSIFTWYTGMKFESSTELNLFSYKGADDFEQDINEYTIIYFIRDPYKRAVSSFIDKHNGEHIFNKVGVTILQDGTILPINGINFCRIDNNTNFLLHYSPSFVNHLCICTRLPSDHLEHHIALQTKEKFIEGVTPNKVFDIESINYDYLNDLYGKILPDEYKVKENNLIYQTCSENNAYTPFSDLSKPYPNYKSFYTHATKEFVEHIYEKDFEQFKEWGFNYKFDLQD